METSQQAEAVGGFLDRWLAKRAPKSQRDLTAGERRELRRMAMGMSCKESAGVAELSPESVRAYRKRIYRVLGLEGHPEVLGSMLADALQAPGVR